MNDTEKQYAKGELAIIGVVRALELSTGETGKISNVTDQ